MIERRYLLGGLALGGAVIGAPMLFAKSARPKAQAGWQLSDAEWKKRLSPLQYRVLREAATERAFTSTPDREKPTGPFLCPGCARPPHSPKTQFDSGTHERPP